MAGRDRDMLLSGRILRKCRPHKPFRFERDMLARVSVVLQAILDQDSDSQVYMAQELTVGRVSPDVLIAKVGGRFTAPKRTLSYIDAHVLTLIHELKRLSEADVVEYVHLTEPAANRAIRNLEKAGLITREDSGEIKGRTNSFILGVEIVALEFKLRRWREALVQAESYLEFADRSYVVLDANQVQANSAMLEAFAYSGVGLLLQRGACVEHYLPARTIGKLSPERIVAIQKISRYPVGRNTS